MKELHILEQVYVDLKDGSDFYEKQDPGCGDYFYGSLRADMLALTQFHGLHPRRYGHRCMVSRTRDMALLGQDGFWLAVGVTVVVAIYAMATILSAFQGPPPPKGFLNL